MVNKAEVGRFDGELKVVAFNTGDQIGTLLNKAGISLGSGESINNNSGDEVSETDQAQNGETYYIVGNYKQG